MRRPVALVATVAVLFSLAEIGRGDDKNYLEAAIKAGHWIRAGAVSREKGVAWPADPRDPRTISNNLYSGTAGVVIFLLELYRSTSNHAFLKDAQSGADHLLDSIESEKENGLYTGIAGIGFALQETFNATLQDKYKKGAYRCARMLKDRAVTVGDGVEWNETADIISGGAGITLFLLYASRETSEKEFRDLAIKAGRRLVALGRREGAGVKWAMSAKYPRLMPNFSHGTAGIAYCLATLYQVTREKEFLDPAVAGAKYLLSVAKTEGDVCMIFHNEPDGKDLYYMGWCHGPVGTARLFYRLYLATGDQSWLKAVKQSAQAVLQSGIPERQVPGFWNNVSQCCGSAGIADFFLSLHVVTRDPTYLDYSRRVADHLLTRASSEGDGMKWMQAEHRVKPDLLVAQTGYMQGAAGVGVLLLHHNNFSRGKRNSINFPDSPFQ